jgi:hypothetical protein
MGYIVRPYIKKKKTKEKMAHRAALTLPLCEYAAKRCHLCLRGKDSSNIIPSRALILDLFISRTARHKSVVYLLPSS